MSEAHRFFYSQKKYLTEILARNKIIYNIEKLL